MSKPLRSETIELNFFSLGSSREVIIVRRPSWAINAANCGYTLTLYFLKVLYFYYKNLTHRITVSSSEIIILCKSLYQVGTLDSISTLYIHLN